MKILWLCNIVLPEFAAEFGIKKAVVGGWMSGMLSMLNQCEGLEIGLCIPIIDEERMKNGVCGKNPYYSFHFEGSAVHYLRHEGKMVTAFTDIIEDFKPDLIHIWGTEYPHSHAMMQAAIRKDMQNHMVISIQGMVSVCAKHYIKNIPAKYTSLKVEGYGTLEEDQTAFEQNGELEREVLSRAKYIIGRTCWDRACTQQLNQKGIYFFCNEVLREEIYRFAGTWRAESCEKYSIFVSQASYPLKGFHFLLEALPVIRQEFPDIVVNIAGADIIHMENPGPYALYLLELIEKHGLQPVLHFTGPLSADKMCENYQNANVFVSSSTIENSPNSLCEAMLVGTPVISSFVGGIADLIAHGKTGYLYQYDAPYMLAFYVCELFRDAEKAAEMSAAAGRFMQEVTDRSRNAENNLEIYRKIDNIKE